MFVNHYCLYVLDPDWGPAFIKTCAYAAFPVWLYLNGHEWAKRQAAPAAGARERALEERIADAALTA